MKKTLTLSTLRHLALAAVLTLAGQSAWAQIVCTPLSGTTGASSAEGYASLVDGSTGTKWCVTNFSRTDGEHNTAYIVFRTSEKFNPTVYYLTTGGDTQNSPERNWKTWNIYGGNFASEEEATKDADGWVLIDQKENLSSATFPAGNTQTTKFTFSESPAESYEYYKLEVYEVTSATSGSAMQMSEFGFTAPVEKQKMTAVTGNSSGLWGDGKYENLVDNNTKTKWGGNTVPTYVILKADQPISPNFYNVITANDTGSNPTRNWKNWQIYGANFDNDSEAVQDATDWVLLDDRVDVGTDRLSTTNYCEHSFGFNVQEPQNMQYYKIELESTGGSQHQMSEFFVSYNEESLAFIRNRYYSKAKLFDLNITCQTALKDEYRTMLQTIKDATDVETTMQRYAEATAKQTEITENNNQYKAYQTQIDFIKTQVENKAVTAVGADILNAYLTTNQGPSDQFPNGTYLYIMEQTTLSTEAITAENSFISSLMDQYAELPDEDPIVSGLTWVNGDTGFNANEASASLVDGDESTKWCANTSHQSLVSGQWNVIVKADEAIKPVFYKLVTGGDTAKNPSRNWRNWKIYGANFDTDEDATVDATAWTLIDNKQNIGQDQLPAASTSTYYFYLSETLKEAYQYYKIEIDDCYNGGTTMQMGEFVLMNNGNLREMREVAAEDYSVFLEDEIICQQSLIDSYKQGLKSLQSVTNVSVYNTTVNNLVSLQTQISTSMDNYANYMAVVDSISSMTSDETDFAYLNSYLTENLAPGSGYPNGTYAYIMETRLLNDTEIKNEAQYVCDLYNAAMNGAYIALSGSAGYNAKEGFAALVDGDTSTKWAGSQISKNAHCIFRTNTATTPFFYSLNIGGDTEKYSGRNWKTWTLSGGNFASDGEATQEAEGWTVIDQRTDMDTYRMPVKNHAYAYFGFVPQLEQAYKYYKIEVTAAASGDYIQMSEFHFGDKDEFEVVREEIAADAESYEMPEYAEAALIEEYPELTASLEVSADMETLMERYIAVQKAQEALASSATAYANYLTAVDKINLYMESNELESTDADLLRKYLNGEDDEQFPNGSYDTVLDNHILNDSLLEEEINFINTLWTRAISTGYITGTEVTSLLQNADFSKGWTGWEGTTAHGYTTLDGYVGAEGWEGNFDMHQTITGLKPGYYEMRVNAGYRPSASIVDDNKEYDSNLNYAAYIYANDVRNYIMSDIEGMISADDATSENAFIDMSQDLHDIVITEEDGETVKGYIMRGPQSVAKAVQGDRYVNSVMTQVGEDGTLTLGITDPGTGYGTDWTGFGNVRLFYRGTADEATDAMDYTLQGMSDRATTISETYESRSDLDNYIGYPNFGNTLRDDLRTAVAGVENAATAAQKYALINQFSALFKQVREAKEAYIALYEAQNNVYEKYCNITTLSDAEYNSMEEAVYDIVGNWEDGAYTAEQALAAKKQIYTDYPDYLLPDSTISKFDVECNELEPFGFNLVTTGRKNPSLAFSGFYEDLNSEERYVLAFDYRSTAAVTGGKILLGTTFIDSSREYLLSFDETDDWKTVYLDLYKEMKNGWGSQSHYIVFYPSYDTAVSMDVRKFRMLTEDQVIAEGGTVDAISKVTEDTVAPAVEGIYTLTGVRVSKAQKGLYIVNGKKVLVK